MVGGHPTRNSASYIVFNMMFNTCLLWIHHHPPSVFFLIQLLTSGTFVAGAAGSGKLMAVDDVLLGLGNSVKLMGKGARNGPLNIKPYDWHCLNQIIVQSRLYDVILSCPFHHPRYLLYHLSGSLKR